ncbi:MAG: site-specific integrase, partial [Gammaproteobacteria bacterium]|nr:site-specific integrase [Gammaproteobacteria bacterium]
MRIPDVVRRKLGICEVHRSLKTYDRAKARLLAAVLVPRLQEIFRMATATTMDREQLTALLQSHFHDLANEVDSGYLPTSELPQFEILEQREMSRERISLLTGQIELNTYDPGVRSAAANLMGVGASQICDLPTGPVADACQGVARAEVEQLRLLLHRLTDRLTPYYPSDPLFVTGNSDAPADPTMHWKTTPAGPSLGAVIEHHLQTGKSKWTSKTYEAKRTKLAYLVEHISADTPITAITADMIRSFKAAISRLRSNHHAGNKKTFADKQTLNENLRIAAETVLNIYNPTRAFFAWATNVEGYLSANPAANIRIETPKKVKGEKSRRAFTQAELQTLFSAPVFTGCASPKRRFDAGQAKLKDDYFWIPVLALYSGARLGELVQLHLRDVVTDGPTPYIEITETVDNSGPDQPQKHVKSEAGVRKIPLHPDVIELGFGEFVARRRKQKLSPRLFYLIKFGADRQASTVFSKWFARLLDKQGLKDPTLTFHSLRHGMQEALQNAKLPPYLINRLFGHSSGTTAEEYGARSGGRSGHAFCGCCLLDRNAPSN